MEVFAADIGGGASGYGRRIAALDSGGVWQPSCSAESGIVHDGGVQSDQTLAHSIVDLVEVSKTKLIDGEVLVHEKRHDEEDGS